MKPKQETLFDGRVDRDIGIARTLDSNADWLPRAITLMERMRAEVRTITGEDVRVWLLSHGLEQPTSPHAWGALMRTAATRGMIVDTGRTAQMKIKQSHARRTPLWRFK